jgi:hypothetical protein
MEKQQASTVEAQRGRRLALVVAVSQYDDPALRELRAPAGDATDLRDVLADPAIGGFEVTSVLDLRAQQIRLAVEELVTDRRPDDLLLVYLSCHGLVDLRRRLYFAARDTRKDRLASSGVEAHWLLDQLEDCRARRQVVVLDCCFSGAFAQGAKGDPDLALGERLLGQGRGRVVLTASRGTEYSFEGTPTETASAAGSVFTGALVAGIRTGAADADQDGYISVDEAYAYAFDQVRRAGAAQTPQRWLYGAEGGIVLARSPRAAGDRPREPFPAPEPAGTAPSRPPEAERRRRARWWVPAAVAAVVVVTAAVAGVLALHGKGGGDGQGSGSASTATRGAYTATGPWRLVVHDESQHDAGCDVLVTGAAGTVRRLQGVYSMRTFQVPGRGRFRWTTNDPGCIVVAEAGPGDAGLPFLVPIATGDSDAFRPRGRVAIRVTDFEGSPGCDLQHVSVSTGRPVALGAAAPEKATVVLDAQGESRVYVAEPECTVRVLAAGSA